MTGMGKEHTHALNLNIAIAIFPGGNVRVITQVKLAVMCITTLLFHEFTPKTA